MDYSAITDSLYIGKTPLPQDYPRLVQEGVQLVINMRLERRPYPDRLSTGLQFLWLPTVDSPLIPISIRLLIHGVKVGIKAIDNGHKVYTHCASGIHRGVTMGACILIALRYSASEAMELIKSKRPIADPYIWYIRNRILRFEQSLRKNLP